MHELTVLNPALHAFLGKTFGRVKVAKRGEPMRYRATADVESGAPEVTILDGGEEYMVCCPMCGDKRHRLSVNHMYGSTVAGVSMLHMAHCWNERCEHNGLRDALYREWQNYREYGSAFTSWSKGPKAVAGDGPITAESVVQECAAKKREV